VKPLVRFLFIIFLSLVCLEKTDASNLILSWSASANASVTGYDIYYGTNSGNYPYLLNAGNTNLVTIANLSPGVTYYFAATAYDAEGDQSTLSSEISYLVPGMLTLASGTVPGTQGALQFSVAPGSSYEIQASTDLINWTSIWQSGVVTTNGWMQFTDPAASSYASRCYRLVEL
jgi:hypothetical protein